MQAINRKFVCEKREGKPQKLKPSWAQKSEKMLSTNLASKGRDEDAGNCEKLQEERKLKGTQLLNKNKYNH